MKFAVPLGVTVGVCAAIGAVLGGIVGYLAWRQAQPPASTAVASPGLKLEVVQINFADGDTPNDTYLHFIIAVSNQGTPTIADRWRLVVQLPEREHPLELPPGYIDPTKPIMLQSRRGAISKISQDDILYNKTIKAPISTGAKIVGVLKFRVPAPRATVERKGTRFTVQCRDVNDNLIAVSYTFGDWPEGDASFHSFPGMKPPPQ